MDTQYARQSGPWRAHPSLDLRDYVNVVLKRRFLVSVVALTVLAVSIVDTLRETPAYRASALIQIGWVKINLVQDVIVEDAGGSARSALRDRGKDHAEPAAGEASR